MENGTAEGLLETIREASGFCYLSDLRVFATSLQRIHLPDKDRYSLKEWTEAVNYITEGCREFKTVDDALRYLSSFLEES